MPPEIETPTFFKQRKYENDNGQLLKMFLQFFIKVFKSLIKSLISFNDSRFQARFSLSLKFIIDLVE